MRWVAASLCLASASPALAGGNPCSGLKNRLVPLCQAAGFYAGGVEVGKGLEYDCLDPILAGLKVEGVPSDALTRACARTITMQQCHVDGTRSSPCDRVVADCQAAGYREGGAAGGRGLWWDCVIPLLAGDLRPNPRADRNAMATCLDDPSALFLREPLPPATPPAIPGVPDAPSSVAVLPFYWKPAESPLEQTKVVVEGAVDGVHGLFVVDTGAPILSLNRTFLQPSPNGGVELATARRRLPERNAEDLVEVAVQLGEIQVVPAAHRYPKRSARAFNAELSHEWGNYAWHA